MKVLVTRAEPAASETAQRLREVDLEPVVFPLFEIRDTGHFIDATDHDGTILTSPNAVSILIKRGWRSKNNNLVAWCVGEKTAQTAQKLGFHQVIASDGGGRNLSKQIADHYGDETKKLLYPASTQRAFDMNTALRRTGIELDLVEIYAHEKIIPPQRDLKALANAGTIDCVTAYSEKSAAHMASVLFSSGASWRHAGPDLVAISKNTASTVLNYSWRSVYISHKPTEASMIEKIRELDLHKF